MSLDKSVRRAVKQGNRFPATVIDVHGDARATVRLSSGGTVLRNLQVIGSYVVVGDTVLVDFSSYQPIIEAPARKEMTSTVTATLTTTPSGGGSPGEASVFIGLKDDNLTTVYPDTSKLIKIAGGNGVISTGSSSTITIDVQLPTNSGLVADATGLYLGTPGTITVSSSPSVTGSSHNHDITSSSSPGAAASILATDSGGGITLAKARVDLLGVGTNAPTLPQRFLVISADSLTAAGVTQSSLTHYVTQTVSGNWNVATLWATQYSQTAAGITNTAINASLWVSHNIHSSYAGALSAVYGEMIWNAVVGGASGTISAFTGLAVQLTNTGANTLAITSARGIYIYSPSVGSGQTIAATYGLHIESQTVGTAANYAIYTNQGLVRLGDSVQLDNATPATIALRVTGASGQSTYLTGWYEYGGGNLGYFNYTGELFATYVKANYVTSDWSPATTYLYDLGSLSHKWRALHAAELWVETLVAQETMATIGGRILVGPTTYLTDYLAAAETTMEVEHNNLANGDIVLMEAGGKFEWIGIASAPSGIGPYTYTVTRGLGGSGADDWFEGDAVFNTGHTGSGFIDLYSVAGVYSGYGPTIVGNVRTATTNPTDFEPFWAIGNLDDIYGRSSPEYGVAIGRYGASFTRAEVTDSLGFAIIRGSTTIGQWDTSGNVYIGATGAEHITITSGDITLYGSTGTNQLLKIDGSTVTIGPPSGAERLDITSSAVAIYGSDGSTQRFLVDGDVVTVGPSGGSYVQIDPTNGMRVYSGGVLTQRIYVDGSLQIGRTTTGWANMYFDQSTGRLNFRAGTGTVQAYIDTDGSIKAGGGNVSIDEDGISIVSPSSVLDNSSYKFINGSGNVAAAFYSYLDSLNSSADIQVNNVSPLAYGMFRILVDGSSQAGFFISADAASDAYTSRIVGTASSIAESITLSTEKIYLSASITYAEYGLYVGGSSGTPATGDIIATNDGRFGGGLYVGSVGTNPATGTITAYGAGGSKKFLYLQNTAASSDNMIYMDATSIGTGSNFIWAGDGSITKFLVRGDGAILASEAVRCYVYKAAAQTITSSGSWVAINFDTERSDPWLMHDNSTNNTRITVQYSILST